MTNKDKLLLALLGFGTVAGISLVSYNATYAEDLEKELNNQNRSEMRMNNANHRDDIREAVENNNYEDFKKAIQDSPIQKDVTQEQFEKIVEAHNLRQQGDFEGANKILEDADLNFHMRKMRKFHNKRNGELREILDEANFEKFQEFAKNKERLSQIDTQEEFNELVRAHELREEAREIQEKLGLTRNTDE